MVRTSRCFAGIFLQLGGPDALLGVVRFRCNLPSADFFLAHFRFFSAAKVFALSSNLEATSKCGSQANDPKGERAARLVVA